MENHETKLSERYRRFLITGFGRIFLTRVASIIYVFVIARIVPQGIQDKMILLASVEFITIQIGLFGIGYSIIQRGISEDMKKSEIDSIMFSGLILSFPIIILSSVLSSFFLNLSVKNSILFLMVLGMSIIYNLLMIYQETIIKTHRALISKMIYSIANSISVPIFYYSLNTLDSILMGWGLSMIFGIISNKSILITILQSHRFNFNKYKSIFTFGAPIYILSIGSTLIKYIDNFLIFIFYQEGDTATYYWGLTIANSGLELFNLIYVGIFPLFTKYIKKNELWEFSKLLNSIIRLSLILSGLFFGMLILFTDVIVSVILSDTFEETKILLRYMLLANSLGVVGAILSNSSGAKGEVGFVTKGRIISIFTRLMAILVLFNFRLIGLVIALVVQKISITIYFWIVNKDILDKIYSYMKIIFIYSIFMISSLILSSLNFDLLGRMIIFSVWITLAILLVYVLKPFSSNDIKLIESSTANKLVWIYSILHKFSNKS